MALVNLIRVQHTDPGAVPLGARPLPVESDSEEDDDDDQNLLDADGMRINSNGGRSISPRSGKPRTRRTRRRGIRRCRKCHNNYKPPRSHHDSVTGRCIVKFDHFCPWAGNAIGAMNHKFFFLFVLYTFITSITSLFLIVLRFFRCSFRVKDLSDEMSVGSLADLIVDMDGDDGILFDSGSNIDGVGSVMNSDTDDHNATIRRWLDQENGFAARTDDYDDDENSNTTFMFEDCEKLFSPRVLILLIMSVAFMIFTCCMLVEQADAIESNKSKIARMKIAMGQETESNFAARVDAEECNEMFGVGYDTRMSIMLRTFFSRIGFGGRGSFRGGRGAKLHWFLPTPVKFPEGKLDTVMGFEYKQEWYGKVYDESMDYEVEESQNQPHTSSISQRSARAGSLGHREGQCESFDRSVEEAELGQNGWKSGGNSNSHHSSSNGSGKGLVPSMSNQHGNKYPSTGNDSRNLSPLYANKSTNRDDNRAISNNNSSACMEELANEEIVEFDMDLEMDENAKIIEMRRVLGATTTSSSSSISKRNSLNGSSTKVEEEKKGELSSSSSSKTA